MILSFDCYGTLLDMQGVDRALTAIADAHGVSATQVLAAYSSWEDRLMYGTPILPYTALIRRNLEYVDMTLGCDVFAAASAQVVEAYAHLRPFPEVVPALQVLREAGHYLLLMSNTTDELMSAHRHALGDCVDATVTATETGCYKPTLAFFQTVAERVPAGLHLHVAHGFWWDMVPATALGWRRLWINRDHLTPIPTMRDLPQLPDLSGLPAYIARG